MNPLNYFSSAARIAGGVAVIVLLVAAGWWHHNRYMLRAEHDKFVSNVALAGQAAQKKAEQAETKVKDELNQTQAKYAQDVAALRNRAAALSRELQNRPSRRDVSQAAAAGCQRATATGADLYRDDAQFLAGQAARADEIVTQLTACQAVVKSYVEAMQ